MYMGNHMFEIEVQELIVAQHTSRETHTYFICIMPIGRLKTLFYGMHVKCVLVYSSIWPQINA